MLTDMISINNNPAFKSGVIFELVTWNQIKVLLKLDDPELLLFYSRLLVKGQIQLDEIGKSMSNNVKQAYIEFQQYRESLPIPKVKEEITVVGNSKRITKTIYVKSEPGYEFGNFYFDFFTNPYFTILAGLR